MDEKIDKQINKNNNSENEIYVKICPKCGSTNVVPYTPIGTSIGVNLINHCKNCHYGYPFGGFFPEVEKSQIDYFRKEIKKNKKKT